ncbi:SH2 domain-containing adapter protein E-like [Syngnathoides biaculeatus]|uniref:SH2 domain-containing adapter protein E-like n=1 Tax=Syngnathoides biaculeatus TaxID=300417 RepID=UPI002ADE89E8|nr:SH2 domain-containing adapter protein E-like [Syngnathoides biaculeatus]XP_061673818.1 SH2 domain-containing adapter protein E-like [Syngnathoides biaculeatus]
MARWFKEFPINLKNGTKTSAFKTGQRKNSSGDDGGLVGTTLLPGRNRKNSPTELNRGQKDGKPRDGLPLAGKGRKNSRTELAAVSDEIRNGKGAASCAYISRMVRVDTMDKSPNFDPGTVASHQVVPDADKQAEQSKMDSVTILEDYADPFDAHRTRQQRESERVGDNDGYMEPYDAQQMITEIRRRGSKDLLRVQMEAGEILMDGGQPEGIGEGEAHYETSGGPPRDDAPQKQTQHHQHKRQKSWTQKILRPSTQTPSSCSSPGSPPETLTSSIDPTRPLEKQSWYHGSVTRQEAELQLLACKEASFLVRNSESDSSKYSIALKTRQGCVHIMVAQTKGNGFTLDQNGCVFPSIPEVVHHYRTRRLPFNGAEHMTLMHPVPRGL